MGGPAPHPCETLTSYPDGRLGSPHGPDARRGELLGCLLLLARICACFSFLVTPAQRLIAPQGVNDGFSQVKIYHVIDQRISAAHIRRKTFAESGSSMMMTPHLRLALALAACAMAPTTAIAAPASPPAPPASYATVADLADSSGLVVRARIKKLSQVEPERVRGVAQGWGRFYVEAKTESVLTGPGQGEALRYLVDLPLDERGKAPKLKNASVLLFARDVRGRPGELQLVAPDAQLPWSPENEARVRGVLIELVAEDAPPRVIGVREAIHVPGNLAGQGETQFFLDTSDKSAASITVQHRPGSPPAWGASFSEIAAATDTPPARDTLTWYRLACFLPRNLPDSANLSETPESRARAVADYDLVMAELGTCSRTRS